MNFKAVLLSVLLGLSTTTSAGTLGLLGAGPGARAGGGSGSITYNWSTGTSIAAGGTSVTTSKGANTINSGDYLVIFAGSTDNATQTMSGFTCPATWTKLTVSTGTNGLYNAAFNDVIIAGACGGIASTVGTGGAYTPTWTGATNNTSFYILVDVSGQNATPVDDAGVNHTDAWSQTWDAPAVTASVANDMLLSFYVFFTGDATDPVSNTAGMTLRKNTYDADFEPEALLFTSSPGSGSTGTKNVATGPSTTGIGAIAGQQWNVLIKGP